MTELFITVLACEQLIALLRRLEAFFYPKLPAATLMLVTTYRGLVNMVKV